MNIELTEIDTNDEQVGDRFKQVTTAVEFVTYQQLFWLSFAHGRAEFNPEDWTVKISPLGVDLESKNGSLAFMGHWASTQTILHGTMLLLDDIIKMLGGNGIPRDIDENGEVLPLDVEKVKAEIKRLVETR